MNIADTMYQPPGQGVPYYGSPPPQRQSAMYSGPGYYAAAPMQINIVPGDKCFPRSLLNLLIT